MLVEMLGAILGAVILWLALALFQSHQARLDAEAEARRLRAIIGDIFPWLEPCQIIRGVRDLDEGRYRRMEDVLADLQRQRKE